MELKKVKSAAAIAILGLTGIMSGNAMANDMDTNQVAYDGLQAVQQHVQERNNIDFTAPILEAKSSVDNSTSNIDNLVLPEQVLTSGEPDTNTSSLENIDDLSVEQTENIDVVPGAVDAGTDLDSQIEGNVGVVSQQESCDIDANSPSLFAKLGGWVLKGTAFVLTVKSAGTAVVPAHAINRTGDYLLKNGCDEFSISEEVYELGKKAVTAGMDDVAAFATDIAIDAVKGKIDEHLEQKEKEAKAAAEAAKSQITVVADGSSNEEIIPEVSVEKTSDKELISADSEPIVLKIDRKAMQELGGTSMEDAPEIEKPKMRM